MKNYLKTGKKWLSVVLTLLLVFGNSTFAGSIVAESSALNPGEVRVDKHRSTYALSPGESTDITLTVEAKGQETPKAVDVVITIDISNSMVNNKEGTSTVMKLTQDAAKALADKLLSSNNGSRVALVRYGDFASVFDFQNNVWIMLNEDTDTSSAPLIGNNLYTSDLSKVKSRIDAIRSNRDTGYIREKDNKWYSKEDQGGTTTEAGLILTKLVAQKATRDSYVVFMSDGVPTSRMIGKSGNADGLYGITRDGSGSATSDAEKSEALAAAASLKALSNTGVFSVAITLGLSGTNLANAREVMKAVASKNSMYFETSSPSSNIDDIYIGIGKTIVDKIANNAVVTDIVPKYFSVSKLGSDMVATPMSDGTTKIEWTIGNLMDGKTENQYTLKLKEGYYGIIDTNESAVLTYSDHYMGEGDPNTLADRTFPIPEIKAQPTAKDDSYTTPDNVNPYEIPNTILDNDNNQKIDNKPYDDRSGNDYTPLSDRDVQDYKIVIVDPLGEGEGEITSFNYETGKFTYVPNQSRPADPGKTTYTVDFTYKLVSKDDAGAYVSNVATVTITVPYQATGSLALSGKKTLTGRGLSAGEFEFELYEGSTLLKTVSNQDDGSFSFNLNYTLSDVGTKTYKVKEKAGSLGGVTYAINEYTVKVAISDNGNGLLNVVVTEGSATALNFRNTYAATGRLALSGKKTLTGRGLSAGEFEFELYEGSTLLKTVSNQDDGSFSFNLNYTLSDVGTKTYKVKEKAGSLGGVTYAINEYTVKVAISDNGNGLLNVVVTEGSATALNFENTYAATGRLALSGKKTLTGRGLSAGEFEFELYEGSTLLKTVSNQDDGSFSFNLNYTLSDVGTKTYKVKEKAGSLGGVTYAINEYTVKVAISDNGNGLLNVVVTEGSATALNFENTYAATGRLALSGKKTLTGRGLSAGEFEFELYEGSTLLKTVSNQDDGSFSFNLNYTLSDVGTKTYKVKEKAGSLGGVTYAINEYTVKVAISDNGNGLLNVVVTEGSATALNFENTYAATGRLALSGKKTLTGRGLSAGEFEFELYEGSTLLKTVSNQDDGSFSFNLNYTLSDVGTKTYKVKEKAGSLGGVTYAINEYTVKVAISDNGNGLLNVVVTEGSATALNFENTYAATGRLALSGKKTLTGRGLSAGEFEFELYEGSTLLKTVSNQDDGSFSFNLNYTLSDVGTKTYKVKEKAGSLGGVTYAINEYTVKVAISDNGNGLLNVVVTEGSATALNFENTYAATGRLALSGKKTLTGRGLSAGEFEFELYEGSTLLKTVSNQDDGSFSFNLNYTLSDVGTKTYKVKEKAGSQGAIIYDTTVFMVEVEISDNGDGTLNVSLTEGSDDPEALDFTNILKTYYIELLKLDSRDEKTPLSGATFELRRAVGTEILIPGDLLETLTTDSEGRALTTAAYAPGTYFLVETVPPSGFHPITKPMQIIISDEAENGSTITVTIMNDFISAPSLTINKQVANVTVGGAAADLVAAKVGETVEYTVVVVNDGNTILTDVYLTDDQAVIGGAVEVNGTATVWITGPGGLAMIELGDMVPGDAITIVYTYDIAAEDLAREPITNTATANGTMQPTPKDPEGAVIEVSDSAIVTVEEIPLGVVAIELTKNVQNVTNGGTPGDLAGGRPGDKFRYTLVITNTGEADLSDLILTDDQVAAGGTVKQVTADTTLTWIANGSNAAYLELGDLASGESIVLTYEYTTPASDAGEIRINRAHVIATATATLGSETPVTVEDEDTASIAVESIPKTGEQDNGLPMVGLALLVAAGVLTILRRRNRKSQEQ